MKLLILVFLFAIFDVSLCGVLLAQDQIIESSPAFFADLSEEELDEWISLLIQWKSEHWVWPNHIENILSLPWIDETWIKSALIGLNDQDMLNMLNHAYRDEVTATTLAFLYKHSKEPLFRKFKKPTNLKAHFQSSTKWVNVPSEPENRVEAAQLVRIETESATIQLNLARKMQRRPLAVYQQSLIPKGFSYQKSINKTTLDITVGALRYGFGSGMIGNIQRRNSLSVQSSLGSYSNRMSVWNAKDHSASVRGVGLSFSRPNYAIYFSQGLRYWAKSYIQSTSDSVYTNLTRSSIWLKDSTTALSSTLHRSLYGVILIPNGQIGFGALQSKFDRQMYQDRFQKNRIDYELNTLIKVSEKMNVKAHIGLYDSYLQHQILVDHKEGNLRFRYLFYQFQQASDDLIRRIELIKGSYGKEVLHQYRFDIYGQRNRKRISFSANFLSKTDQWARYSSDQRYFHFESIFYPQMLGKTRFQFLIRYLHALDNLTENEDQHELKYMMWLRHSFSKRLQLFNTITLHSSIYNFTKPSLNINHRLRFNYAKFLVDIRISQLFVEELNPMQRMDVWTASHLIRDTFVRTESGLISQIHLRYSPSPKVRISASVSQQQYQHQQVRIIQGKSTVFTHRRFFNIDLRLRL